MNELDPIAVFRTEAAEQLELIEAGLLDLMRDLSDRAQVDAVFRGLHTLKGSGSMFGFDQLAAFTHHCETAFDRVRKGEAPATKELVSAVLDAQGHMQALLENPNGDHEAMSSVLLEKLRQAVGAAGSTSASAAPASTPVIPAVVPDAGGAKTWHLKFSLPANSMANGTNPLGLLDELRELGECRIEADTDAIPLLAELEPRDLHIGWTVRLTTEKPRSDIEDVFIFVMDEMTMELNELAAPKEPAPAPVVAKVERPVEDKGSKAAAHPVDAGKAPPADAKSQKQADNVRVPALRLDEMMDRVGELVIAQSRLSQMANSAADLGLRSVSEEIERLAGELRDTMMVLRMMPVASLFSRFRRLVHDLARETGKDIELVTEGEGTEVDKTVIDRLADPLVHLVRNSIDHGLESPDDRVAAGKPVTGRVILSAHQTGSEVVISIKDDGRGIDRQRVRAKAEANGLIRPGAQLSDKELLQLIFQPGFSTAEKVTNLSGRGVGMDVVKKTIETLRGAIDITSEFGKGSEIALRIPLTLAIIDGLLVRVGNGRYVIPLAAVEECLELSVEQDLRSRGRSFISLRDDLVPFLRLRELFRTGTEPDPYQKVVVISTGSDRVGLVVDQIIGDHQTVIKSMSKLHDHVSTFSGATILGDGNVALILDVVHLITAGQHQEAQLRAAG
ncbi:MULTISPECIES: chemotaxis protein CheA [Rhizobium]|uniref:Chemotaxis protein CheA n=1 Tax=Rhizobium tropici TaxID=398 RepID=A0A329YC54_RHITR|nr:MULTISPECIES: chemotaxis protein CheA [Rhizobium]MBB3290120.1 two-component system chemotaxis sensor kinase CheA [Rhizobium sp. BK252]MBB3404992.1 two-component system chemotaxis sensor kinase CheA [Rhizobium sp. BK289]MBB3417538.1 two-component system chemotaxis sensor kinase CheA [Rhizobium sp. BK284]MBB3485248.1 two-component system chemotaxis sensor kinase CheA [Rhizobium sp. BK347]MDK4720917.1 chemotaxis protein CheA [Rhizobium sp. CNPSo 3968]